MLTLQKAESLLFMMREAGINEPDMENDIVRTVQMLDLMLRPPVPVPQAAPPKVKTSRTCEPCAGTGWSRSASGRCTFCAGKGKVFE
jgi:hypothetical protein